MVIFLLRNGRARLAHLLSFIGALSITGCVDHLEPGQSRSSLGSVGTSAPPRSVAVAGLAELAGGIPRDRTAGYGFRDQEALRRASVGSSPLHVLIEEPGSPAEPRQTRTWRFLVQVDGRTVSLLTVAWHQGRWQAVTLGAAGLASELSELTVDQRSALLFIPHLQSHFLVQRGAGDAPKSWRYLPLASARRNLGAEATWIDHGRLKRLLGSGSRGGAR